MSIRILTNGTVEFDKPKEAAYFHRLQKTLVAYNTQPGRTLARKELYSALDNPSLTDTDVEEILQAFGFVKDRSMLRTTPPEAFPGEFRPSNGLADEDYGGHSRAIPGRSSQEPGSNAISYNGQATNHFENMMRMRD